MKIIESYMPVFQKWGDNALCIYNDPHDPSRDEDSIFYGIDSPFYNYFLYYGYKVSYALHTLYSDRDGLDLRELMMAYKTGRAV